MNAISKVDGTIGAIKEINSKIEPVRTTTKTNHFYKWLERCAQSQYEAWERVNRPEQH